MMTRAELLAQRQRRLLADILAQRTELAKQAQPLTGTLASMETGLRIVDRLRRHPEWLVGAAIGLIVIRPRRLSALLQWGTNGLRAWRQMAPALQHFITQD